MLTAQRAVKRWLARRHKAASVIQQAVREFLLLRRQQRVQQGIVKAQVLQSVVNFEWPHNAVSILQNRS